MKTLTEMESYIKSQNPNIVTIIIHNNKLNKDFLFTYRKSNGSTRFIKIFDVENGFNEIASISYSVATSTLIIEFETNENYQGNGIGRLMFDIALAHADKLGSTRAYGQASPTNNVKGITPSEDNAEEQKAINQIYKKLGCTLHHENSQYIDTTFDISWNPLERYNESSELIKEIIKQILQQENSIKNEKQQES